MLVPFIQYFSSFSFSFLTLYGQFLDHDLAIVLLYVKVVSNFCHRESKSEFAGVRRYFWTKDLDVKIRRKKQKAVTL